MTGTTRRVGTGVRWASIIAVGALASVLLSSCLLSSIGPPSGAAPLRYRDTIFTNVTKTSNLQYGSAPDNNGNPVALMLDLYQPTGDTATARPVVIWAHGGGFSTGDKGSGVSPFMANTMAQLGYATLSINYRLLAPPGCSGANVANCAAATLEAIHDGQAAVRWVRANAATYHLDPNRIGIGGESAGAIIATGVGLWSDSPGVSGNPGFSSSVNGWMSLSGGLPNGLFATPGDPAGLLFTGTADPIVPTAWSSQTAAAIDANGGLAVLEQFPGQGHVPFVQNQAQIVSQTENFFYLTLNAVAAVQ